MIVAKFMPVMNIPTSHNLFDSIQISRVGLKSIVISYQNEEFSQSFVSEVAICSPRLPIFSFT